MRGGEGWGNGGGGMRCGLLTRGMDQGPGTRDQGSVTVAQVQSRGASLVVVAFVLHKHDLATVWLDVWQRSGPALSRNPHSASA